MSLADLNRSRRKAPFKPALVMAPLSKNCRACGAPNAPFVAFTPETGSQRLCAKCAEENGP